ncbi:MAG: hypothetical protein Kow0062_21540 [Acidobacteriota bacterium]
MNVMHKHRLIPALAGLALLAVASAPASAAILKLALLDGETFTVHTGTDEGTCAVVVRSDETVAVSCDDPLGNGARADSAEGCGDTWGRGFCARGDFGISTFASSQLNCIGVDYDLTTGTEEGTCTRSGSGSTKTMTCDDGRNSATASCDKGCHNDKKKGSGDCIPRPH